jgi:hypothetical protein
MSVTNFTTSRLNLVGDTSGAIILRSPANPTSYTLIFPSTVGSPNTFLQTDGSGNLSWTNPTSFGIGYALSAGWFML